MREREKIEAKDLKLWQEEEIRFEAKENKAKEKEDEKMQSLHLLPGYPSSFF